jgi:rubrerythrin
MTRPYAVLPVSAPTYDELREKLDKAGYSHQFIQREDCEVIGLNGIAIKAKHEPAVKAFGSIYCGDCNYILALEDGPVPEKCPHCGAAPQQAA